MDNNLNYFNGMKKKIPMKIMKNKIMKNKNKTKTQIKIMVNNQIKLIKLLNLKDLKMNNSIKISLISTNNNINKINNKNFIHKTYIYLTKIIYHNKIMIKLKFSNKKIKISVNKINNRC